MVPESNGFRVTSRQVYEEVVAARQDIATLREMLLEERGRVDGLVTQVRLLWTLCFGTIATIGGIAVAVVRT